MESMTMNLKNLPNKSRTAVIFIVDSLINSIYPLLKRISDQLHNQTKDEILDENFTQIRNVYTLCADQIKKCILILLDIIKIEYRHHVCLQESRQCTIERICWCTQKLNSIEQLLENPSRNMLDSSQFLPISNMYFVNWIDQTFYILEKLSNVISRNDFKQTEELSNEWKKELLECVCGLHTAVDELLLSAMTLCRHCLPSDQYVVRARCQVVLRETKTLLSELIQGDIDTVHPTIETLKLPIMPFNINVRIDVLKDVLGVLETNTNAALLALVVHCFGQDVPLVDTLKQHYENSSTCMCTQADDSDVAEKCTMIKEFDLYNERLLQIGSFAMSCSSDQKRILNLRSGLASLEALEPHLVPAVMLSPRSHHADILARTWSQETRQIRDSVFLIVDPAAFADKARQMMRQRLLELLKQDCYDSTHTRSVINVGCVVHEFFEVYEQWERDALSCHDQLEPLLRDLNKGHGSKPPDLVWWDTLAVASFHPTSKDLPPSVLVRCCVETVRAQIECKIVSNLLSAPAEHKYGVRNAKKSPEPTVQQLKKRLKLLYTLVKRINLLYNPLENDDEFYQEDEHLENKYCTQVKSPKKNTYNFSKSAFARTNVRSSTGRFPLATLTKHLKRDTRDLSFSLRLDGCDISELKLNREPSILYRSPKSRASLRKVVLCKKAPLPLKFTENGDSMEKTDVEDSVMDEAMSLQITDVLNQINDLTFNVSTEKPLQNNSKTKKCMKHSVNYDATFKRVWNISINGTETASNMTQPSEVNTLERINDLDLLESRLSDLKSGSGHIETSL